METSSDSFSVDDDHVIITSSSPHPFDDEVDDDDSYFRVDAEAEEPIVTRHVSGGSILPEMDEMKPEEGFLLGEWCRQNMMLLENKEKMEKEQREQIILEAEEYKHAFNEKRKLNVETNKLQNRQKEKLFLTNNEKFHASASNQYWKAISDLIPHEIVNIEKKRGKKGKEKNKPSIAVIQGPKPGKPTDMSRMRHILLKLKHNPPTHMKPIEPVKQTGSEPVKAAVASTSVPVSVA